MEPTLLSLYILREMTIASSFGQRLDHASLASRVGVRKEDVRAAVTSLHKEGYIDATTMRVCLAGFVLGRTARKVTLKELRKQVAELQLVAA